MSDKNQKMCYSGWVSTSRPCSRDDHPKSGNRLTPKHVRTVLSCGGPLIKLKLQMLRFQTFLSLSLQRTVRNVQSDGRWPEVGPRWLPVSKQSKEVQIEAPASEHPKPGWRSTLLQHHPQPGQPTVNTWSRGQVGALQSAAASSSLCLFMFVRVTLEGRLTVVLSSSTWEIPASPRSIRPGWISVPTSPVRCSHTLKRCTGSNASRR